jgi:hypothetical protein
MTKRQFWGVFWCGVTVSVAVTSLRQDWYGLEGYVEHLQSSWVSGWWTVPFALTLFVVAMGVLTYFRMQVVERCQWCEGQGRTLTDEVCRACCNEKDN